MNKGQSFPEFAMLCARAFGACVMMRDDSMDTPIPDEFQPSDYHLKRIETTRADRTQLQAMTDAERETFGQTKKNDHIKSVLDAMTKNSAEDARIDEMIGHVKAWTPPTPDHAKMKEFMLEQLNISRNGSDYYPNRLKELEAKTPLQYYAEALEEASRSLAYHIEENQKEIDRAKSRTEWVRQLRHSLKGVQ